MNPTRQHASLSEAERLNAVASLGDPVRKRLFELLRESPHALSRDDCAQALGLPKSTIRAQLDRLAADGLLLVEFRKVGERTGPGSGRPTKLYTVAVGEVAASVPARHYDLAAELLAAAVQRSIDSSEDVGDALAQVAFEAGKRLGAGAGTIHNLLADTGYDPRPDGQGGTIMANCPFHRLSREHTGVVCQLNGSLLNGVLEGCADANHSIEPDAELSHCCARIVARGA
ncbi:metalloregulator ArsR/SmtB family transcription factor [Arthrobacter sp. STN4]|uniref:helix-turn-helix transcriptional regulator n=1 Tax=Arthrobacter sp. STN4 TaxID=2923276 RepID=UPI00211A17E4|nr:transcriptional regulator [Arthrobacter sp. STN4]MCQ9163070.1 transcriptional regulator [Arthrobacter sp. STN4]